MDRELETMVESIAKKAVDICPLVKTKRDKSVADGVMKLFKEMFGAELAKEIVEKPVETVISGYVEVEEITGNKAEKPISETFSANSGAEVKTAYGRKKK